MMLALDDKSQLEALHSGNVKESLTLEYKASPAARNSKWHEMSVRLQMRKAVKSSTE